MKTILLITLLAASLPTFIARTAEPSDAPRDVRRGVTLHVSKLGDNSDGRSWKTAFHTMQQALDAVPDNQGGHRIIIRPDTYAEANLYPAHNYLRDLTTGQELARFGTGFSFANAFVRGAELNVFASEGSNRQWFRSIHRFWSTNLTNWNRELAIPKEEGEHLFNASVCRDEQGYCQVCRIEYILLDSG